MSDVAAMRPPATDPTVGSAGAIPTPHPPLPVPAPRTSGRIAGRVARSIVLGALDRIEGQLDLDEPAGRHRFGRRGGESRGHDLGVATVRVHHPDTYQRVLTQGSVGLGLSYADGWWDTDDLPRLLRLLERNVRRADPARESVGRLTRPLTDRVRRRRRQDAARDRDDIRAHYDLGNDFFERWLDETMSYSSAIFPEPSASLADASRHKLDRMCRRLDLGPDDHVLEIGTGWGGFAVHAAGHLGCRVTTTTISAEQYGYARDRVRTQGLEHLVTVLDRDYRELDGQYDAIVSIEMIEAVDWREYDTFFRTCHRLLRPTGRLGMQAIVIPQRRFDQAKARRDFIKKVIFPGGCLPSIETLQASSSRVSDLALVDLEDIGLHYAETLRRWRANLDDGRDSLDQLDLDQRFFRLWQFYLAYCEAGFEERDISAIQFVLARPGWRPASTPRTRLYPVA